MKHALITVGGHTLPVDAITLVTLRGLSTTITAEYDNTTIIDEIGIEFQNFVLLTKDVQHKTYYDDGTRKSHDHYKDGNND